MPRYLLLAASLGLVTSCVPNERLAVVRSPARPHPPEGRALLQALALQVSPDAAAGALLPAHAGAGGAVSAPPFLAAVRSEDDAARALTCLTEAVYYEARSESLDGQRAVAQVVLNRVRDRAFPHSVCGVVYQHPSHAAGCQFTFTCDGAMSLPREPRAWDRARAVAEAALAGSVFEPVGSAVFYHTQAILPWWAPSLSRIGSVGAHIFYRWHDALARTLSFRQDYAGIEPLAGGISSIAATMPSSDGTREGGVTVHRERHDDANEGEGEVGPRVIRSAGVRIHLGVAAAASHDGGATDAALPADQV